MKKEYNTDEANKQPERRIRPLESPESAGVCGHPARTLKWVQDLEAFFLRYVKKKACLQAVVSTRIQF